MTYAAGLGGEAQAKRYLCDHGMTCLARRYRGQDGEIDLIMQDGDLLVMVEVKYRPKGLPGDGLRAVTPAKQKRLAHAAQAFLLEKEWMSRSVRFDVVEITPGGIIHIPNAFTPAMWG